VTDFRWIYFVVFPHNLFHPYYKPFMISIPWHLWVVSDQNYSCLSLGFGLSNAKSMSLFKYLWGVIVKKVHHWVGINCAYLERMVARVYLSLPMYPKLYDRNDTVRGTTWLTDMQVFASITSTVINCEQVKGTFEVLILAKRDTIELTALTMSHIWTQLKC